MLNCLRFIPKIIRKLVFGGVGYAAHFLSSLAPCACTMVARSRQKICAAALPNSQLLNHFRYSCSFLLILFPFFAIAQSLSGPQASDVHLIKAKNHKKKKKKQQPQPQQPTTSPSAFQYAPESPRLSSFYDPLVDYYLKNKIILCTGPAFARYEMLKRTVEDDLKLIPFKKIFITTNEPQIVGISFNEKMIIPSQCNLIPNRGKQVDCTNCIISTLRYAVNDPDIQDDDIILFKHESLYINDMELINRAVDKIVNYNFNMVTRDRTQTPEVRLPTAPGGSCTDAFFVRVSSIRELVENYPEITELPAHQWCCELYIWENIIQYIPNIYRVFYCHNNGGPTELGFYHYPSTWDPFWDRQNYHDLYK